jgi:hypothetical protein
LPLPRGVAWTEKSGHRRLLSGFEKLPSFGRVLTAKKTATHSIRKNKSKKEENKGPKNKNLFDFFDFAVNLPFKVCCFREMLTLKK